MSFSSQVKDELCLVRPSGCCKTAEAYGLLLFGRSFTSENLSLQTEHEGVADRFASLLRQVCGVSPVTSHSGGRRELLTVSLKGEADRRRALHRFDHSARDVQLRIREKWLERECCAGAFIRGAFLACGSLTDPQKDYHLEFLIPHLPLAGDFMALLTGRGLSPRMVMRGSSAVVYFKESDHIEDLLTIMGATNSTLELMNIKIYKNVRNKVNRITNCETANLTKTVNAAVAQLEAIERLETSGRLQTLPPALQEAAALRRDNPELSLSELCALCEKPVTRSGFNHRLRKLVELAGQA
ncbi:MAG: DNA-binding protein WhiA [Clostridiales bacterium]|nr:DNA-binding protein WhiA [Clostridiales bacterium]